ncbi:LPXTG cell wall anchor domain-containing protein [Brevibacterium album]|uniref:LPXTG cell wall anchor domain-containing protein n=1 Tax=Brevibacterium album TaxID=417948 RepID=UPI0004056DA4|nr:LPXTG cell wall anchor domain-containing protein [Brevibacterium album]
MKKSILLAPAVAVAIAGLAVGPAAVANAAPVATFTEVPAAASSADVESQADFSLSIDPQTITYTDLADQDKGVVITASGVEANSEVAFSVTTDAEVADFETTEIADENGVAVLGIVVGQGDPAQFVGTYSVTVTDADGDTQTGSFTVTSDETPEPTDEPSETASPEPTEDPTETASPEPTATPTDDETDEAVEYALSVTPEEITPEDFVDEDKGVTLAVEGAEAGEEIEFAVSPAGENITPLTTTETANEDGEVAWNVYGVDASDPSVYLGEYDVVATNEAGEELTGSFTVTNAPGDDDGQGGEDDQDRGKDDGSKLPRTGMELTGLAAGAGLLAVGAATVMLTRRRQQG